MPDAVIDNPILNSPFREPLRHFRFGDEGITSEVVEERRESAYFMPIPAAKKRSQSYVRFLDDFPAFPVINLWEDTQSGSGMDKVYVVQTNTKVIERCLLMTTDPGDLVLDPTAGSGTTPVVAEKWGRRWIGIDTSRVALALARTRVMAARHPAYLLADSPEGQLQEARLTDRPQSATDTHRDVRKGSSTAASRTSPSSRSPRTPTSARACRARRSTPPSLATPTRSSSSISPTRTRGPCASPVPSPSSRSRRTGMLEFEEQPVTEETRESGAPFANTVLENLRKAGVQNTVREEHLDFDSLEPFAGQAIDLQGEFTDRSGETRRVAVAIGPEHGTVGAGQIKEAGQGGAQGRRLRPAARLRDVLRRARRRGRPGVSARRSERMGGRRRGEALRPAPGAARAHEPRSGHGDELLKKTGAGNLFMVFGEPDVPTIPTRASSERYGPISTRTRGRRCTGLAVGRSRCLRPGGSPSR